MTQDSPVAVRRVEAPVEHEEWFQGMVQECQAAIVEAVFRSRWSILEGWHAVGQAIIAEKANIEKSGASEEGVVSRLSQAMSVSKRSLWRAVQFARRYPDLNTLPDGKNITWNKVCSELLPEHRKEKEGAPAPEGEFGVVYADPEWGGGPDSDGAYSAERLAALKIPAAKDSILYLWCPPSRVADAVDVIRSWGFKYQSQIAWLTNAERKNCRYVREIHEVLMVARRGDIGAPHERDRPFSFYATDGVHKDAIRKYLEKMYPRGDRLGVFAEKRKDWTTWSVDDGQGKADPAGNEKSGS
jgi:N6-adenosine-specific RNA methylase IME4